MNKTDITIVVVDYYSGDELRVLIDSLHKYEPHCAIVISSNSCYSKSEAQEFIKCFPDAKILLNEKNGGYSYGVNRALREVDTKYAAVLNPDVEIIAPFSDKAIKLFEAYDKVGAFTPIVLDGEGNDRTVARRFWTPKFAFARLFQRKFKNSIMDRLHGRYLRSDWKHDKLQGIDFCSGGAIFLRTEAILGVGGFDERFFMYMEDVDLCHRLWDKGWIVALNPDVRLIHRAHFDSTRNLLRLCKLLSRTRRAHLMSYFRYYRKWGAMEYCPSDQWNAANGITKD